MSKNCFLIADIPVGKLNAAVKNLMAQMGITDPAEVIRRINAGEWKVTKVQIRRDREGIIHLSVTSFGFSGQQWIERLESQGKVINDFTKQVLLSDKFDFTSGRTTNIQIVPGKLFATGDSVRISDVRTELYSRRGYAKPDADTACLIRENFSDAEIHGMGLSSILVMHEPIDNALFGIGGDNDLVASSDTDAKVWPSKIGFAAAAC